MIKALPKNDYSGFWEYTHNWQIPLKPKKNLVCPVCQGKNVRFKEYFPHVRHYKVWGAQYRIDTWFKCCTCAHVWVHGVSVTEDYYNEVVSKMQEKLGRIRPLHILEALEDKAG